MWFRFLDEILESSPERVVARLRLSPDAVFLRDHFAGYPVMPGVLMLETMVEAARHLGSALEGRLGDRPAPGARTSRDWVLGSVKALKFGRFVRPGQWLYVEVTAGDGATIAQEPDPMLACRGRGWVLDDPPPGVPTGPAGVSGRFELRRARTVSGIR